MRLADIPSRLIEDFVRQWRNRAIAFSVVAICALIVTVQVLSAARVGLEPHLGPVGARLAIAGVFVCIAGLAVLLLKRSERPSPEAAAEQFSRDERVSLIAEAINLGYMVARDLKKPADDPPPDAAAPPSSELEKKER